MHAQAEPKPASDAGDDKVEDLTTGDQSDSDSEPTKAYEAALVKEIEIAQEEENPMPPPVAKTPPAPTPKEKSAAAKKAAKDLSTAEKAEKAKAKAEAKVAKEAEKETKKAKQITFAATVAK